MEIKLKAWWILASIVILVAALGFFVRDSILAHRERDRLSTAIEYAEGKVKFYQVIVDGLEESVAETRAIVVERENQLMLSKEQIERLKAQNIKHVRAIASLNAEVNILKDSLRITGKVDTVYRDVEVIDDRAMIELPLSFTHIDEWATLRANVNTIGQGSIYANLKPVPIDIAIGYRGLFSKEYVSNVSTPSPYIQFDKAQVQIVQSKKPKTFLWGVLTGVAVTTTGIILLTQ